MVEERGGRRAVEGGRWLTNRERRREDGGGNWRWRQEEEEPEEVSEGSGKVDGRRRDDKVDLAAARVQDRHYC